METRALLINSKSTNIKVTLARSFAQRFIGLIGKTELQGKALLLYKCSSIHTFLMAIPIDAIFLTKEGEVIKIIPNIKPFRIAFPVPRADKVLELGSGAASKLGIKLNDLLSFQ
jgi:uncharacterized protein